MAVEAVGGSGGFQAAPVKKSGAGNEKPEIAPKVKADVAAKPQQPVSNSSVDVKV